MKEMIVKFDNNNADPAHWHSAWTEVPIPKDDWIEGDWGAGQIAWLRYDDSRDPGNNRPLQYSVRHTEESVSIKVEIHAEEFNYVIEGSFDIELESGEKHSFSAGDAVHFRAASGVSGPITHRSGRPSPLPSTTPSPSGPKYTLAEGQRDEYPGTEGPIAQERSALVVRSRVPRGAWLVRTAERTASPRVTCPTSTLTASENQNVTEAHRRALHGPIVRPSRRQQIEPLPETSRGLGLPTCSVDGVCHSHVQPRSSHGN